MATRSLIAFQGLAAGPIIATYCHFDGYPHAPGVGATLLHSYQAPLRVVRLIEGGALSTIGPAIEPPPGVPHSFDHPAPGACVYYGRDRGDTGPQARHHYLHTLADLISTADSAGAEWLYLWTHQGQWTAYEMASPDRGWRPLAELVGVPADLPAFVLSYADVIAAADRQRASRARG